MKMLLTMVREKDNRIISQIISVHFLEVVATVEYAKIDRSHRDQSRSSQTHNTFGIGEIEQHSQVSK